MSRTDDNGKYEGTRTQWPPTIGSRCRTLLQVSLITDRSVETVRTSGRRLSFLCRSLFLFFFFCRTVWTVESGRYYEWTHVVGKYRSIFEFRRGPWPLGSSQLDAEFITVVISSSEKTIKFKSRKSKTSRTWPVNNTTFQSKISWLEKLSNLENREQSSISKITFSKCILLNVDRIGYDSCITKFGSFCCLSK